MFSIIFISVILLSVLCCVHGLTCPSSCPLLVSAQGNSECCSVGDGAAGCGLCNHSTCAENNFSFCEENFGIECNLDSPSCQVKSVGGTKRNIFL